MANPASNRLSLLFILLIAAFIFIVDVNTELGVAGGAPYVLVVLLAALQNDRSNLLKLVVLTTLLTLLGAYFSPAGGELWEVFVNRSYAIGVIWAMAILCHLKADAAESKYHRVSSRDSVKTINQITILAISVLVVFISVHYILYKNSFEQQKNRLSDIVKSQKELMEAVAKFDVEFSSTDVPGGAFEATLSQIKNAHENFNGLGETGEITLAKLDGDQIEYLLHHRYFGKVIPQSIPLSSAGEPMRRALSGQSGTIVGLDYRGEVVLSAYEFVPILNLGVVAKIDLSEIRMPFLNSALYGGLVAVFFISLGTIYFTRTGSLALRRIIEIENRLEKTQEISNVMLTHIGLDGGWLKVPPKLCQLLGYAEEELLAVGIKEVTHPDDLMAYWSQCERLIKGEIKSFDLEERFVEKNGEVLWVFVDCSIVEDPRGKPLHFLTYILDVDARKNLENELNSLNSQLHSLVDEKTKEIERSKRALEKNEAYLTNVLTHMVDGIVTINGQGIIISINPEAERIFGYSCNELLGKNVSLLMAEPFAREHDHYLKKYLESGKGTIIGIGREVEGLRKDGTQFPMDLAVSEFHEDGEVRFIGSLRDISQRKRLEVEVALEKDLYKTLLLSLKTSSSGDPLSVGLKYCLKHICEITGWDVGHAYMVSDSKDQLVPSGNWYLAQENLFDDFVRVTEHKFFKFGEGLPGRVFESGKSLWIENITKDSNFPRIQLMENINIKGGYGLPVRVNNEVVAVLEFYCRNARRPNERIIELLENIAIQSSRIFERFQYERSLEKYQNHLEDLVEQRSAKLKSINEELERFVYTASHDLQEPLRKIIVFGDIIKTDFLDDLGERGRDYISRIQKASFRMKDLLEDLLGYSRFNHNPSKPEPADLNAIMQEVIDDLEIQIEAAGADIQLGKLPELVCDKIQIRQVFQNIIVNALKYSNPGVAPVIKVRSVFNGNDSYAISFEDNGIGFDEKYMEQLFAPFKRLHSDSNISGSGMGLFICKKIIERHGGTITVRSKPGEGSTFITTLLAKVPEADL